MTYRQQMHYPVAKGGWAVIVEIKDVGKPLLSEHGKIPRKDIPPVRRGFDKRKTEALASGRHKNSAASVVKCAQRLVTDIVEPVQPLAELGMRPEPCLEVARSSSRACRR